MKEGNKRRHPKELAHTLQILRGWRFWCLFYSLSLIQQAVIGFAGLFNPILGNKE